MSGIRPLADDRPVPRKPYGSPATELNPLSTPKGLPSPHPDPPPATALRRIVPPEALAQTPEGRIASPSAGFRVPSGGVAEPGGPGLSPHPGPLGPIARGGTRTEANSGIVQQGQRLRGNSAAC